MHHPPGVFPVGRALFRFMLPLLLGVLLPSSLHSQNSEPAPADNVASPFLPSQSWALDAVRRVDALGLTGRGFGWGDGSLTRFAVGRALHDAIGRAAKDHPGLEATVAGYWERFASELPATAARILRPPGNATPQAEGRLSAGYSRETGRLYVVRSAGGRGTVGVGPFPRPDLNEAVGLVSASVLSPHFAAALEGERRVDQFTAGESHALLGWRSVAVWGGRRAPAFGPGAGGGLLFSGNARFTGGGIALTEPVRLPSMFRYIGVIRFEAFLSELDSNAAIRHPWVIASHASISPHPRFLIGLTQSFMFAGEGVEPFTWRTFKSQYLSHGKLDPTSPDLNNGLASLEFRFRPPIPLSPVLYVEMGTEDTQGAWHIIPAHVAGLRFPYVRGIPSLSLGVEHTYFSPPCSTCTYYATWYRHYLFKDGWSVERAPIGHELGGDGNEWLGYGSWDDPAQHFRLEARGFRRYRGPYNLYSPVRAGETIGGRLSGTIRLGRKVELMLDALVEGSRGGVSKSSLYAGGQRNF